MAARISQAAYKRYVAHRSTPSRMPPKLQSEAMLLRQLLGWLKAKGIFHFRCNAGGGVRPDGRGGFRPIKGAIEGTPDIICVCPVPTPSGPVGVLVGVEAKAPAGRLRPAQKAWAERARRAGGLVFTVRSLQELIDAFADHGLLREGE